MIAAVHATTVWISALAATFGSSIVAAHGMGATPLHAAFEPDGRLAIHDGDNTIASFIPKTKASEHGEALVAERWVSGHDVLLVRLPRIGQSVPSEEVWLAERSAGGGVQVIWWGTTGALDPDGEVTGAAEVDDTAIRIYRTVARLSRCDGQPVRLALMTWDFTDHAFKPVRPALPPLAPVTIKAHRGGAPEGRPQGGFFFSAASSSPGAASDPSRLRPPVALNDGDATTVWSSEGDARGQLLTARSSGGFAITGLRLLPGRPSTLDSRAGGPRKLALIFSGHADNVDVELEDDADGGRQRAEVPFWIALPRPITSGCVTVVVRETASPGAPLSIAELDVMTEVDGPQAADRLVASLSAGIACTARQPLLARLGQAALPKVVAALGKASPGSGRECLVEALTTMLGSGAQASPEAGAALAGAVIMATPTEERAIAKVLPAMAEPPVGLLAATLRNAKLADADRLRAARILAGISGEAAARALLAVVGRIQPTAAHTRGALREAAAMLKPPAAQLAEAELAATPAAETSRRADLLVILAALARREPTVAREALATLEATLKGPASFEEQARAIGGLGTLKDRDGLTALAELRSRSEDGVLRYLATAELGAPEVEDQVALPALRSALADADPRVRALAAEALGQRRDQRSEASLLAGARHETWTDVRRADVAALGELCTPAADEALQLALKRDVDEVREVALAGIAHCYGAKANPALIHILGRLPESADMRALAARLLAERRDPATVPGLAAALARLVKEVEADLSLHTVVAETAMALAAIRTPEAIAPLVTLLASPSASCKRAGIDALGVACDAGAGAAALRAAARDQDQAVAIPAATAESHCREVASSISP